MKNSFLILGSLLFYGCSKAKSTEETTIEKTATLTEKNEVETIILKNENFKKLF